MVVLRPVEELSELESFLWQQTMFCKREKVLVQNIKQQNNKHTQEYQVKIWIRSLTTIVPMGEKCYKGQQLQESQDIYPQVYRTKLHTS